MEKGYFLFDVSQGIRYFREKLGMTQGAQLCRATGLKRSYAYVLERGKVKGPRLSTIYKLAKAFGVAPTDFIAQCKVPKNAEVHE